MLGVDEVLEGQMLQYYIGLIRLIGRIGLIRLIELIGNIGKYDLKVVFSRLNLVR